MEPPQICPCNWVLKPPWETRWGLQYLCTSTYQQIKKNDLVEIISFANNCLMFEVITNLLRLIEKSTILLIPVWIISVGPLHII